MWRFVCVAQFCALLVIYTYLGLTPHPEDSVPMFNDKLMHFCGYLVAAGSISFALPKWRPWQQATFLICYSIAIEIGQLLSPPRSFSVMDMVANSCGVIVGLGLMWLALRSMPWLRKLL
jgi:VanZ family protein